MSNIKKSLISAWILGIPLSYFVTSFLGHFYESSIGIFTLAVPVHSLVSLFVYHILNRVRRNLQSNPI